MIEFKLPSLGADMDEGTLLEWHIKPGDSVKKGQIVAIVDTSKAAVDLESWQEGTVAELLVEPGARLAVGAPMALFLEAGESPTAAQAARAKAPAEPTAGIAPSVPAPAPTAPSRAASGARHLVSPAARKHAEELGIDIETVIGSGPHGAVTLADVEAAAHAARPTAAPAAAAAPDKNAEMRRAIAAAMARSKREIPHYYVAENIPMAKALTWLATENARRPMTERLLPAALLLKAVAVALRRFPELNGLYAEGMFRHADKVHLGVAISLRQGGLIAPALLDADSKPLTQLMQGLTDLVKRCRAGSLKSSEMSEPTITVTNLGDQGSESVFGVIYPPQVALVGFGRIAERPWADNGGLKVLPTVTASLSADHRVSDGHRGALFLIELRELLQRPEELDQ